MLKPWVAYVLVATGVILTSVSVMMHQTMATLFGIVITLSFMICVMALERRSTPEDSDKKS